MGTVLILGGTWESRILAERLHRAGVDVLTSLAGRTRMPTLPPGRVRVGGFGGAEGFARVLAAEAVAFVLDATHPFAVRMTATAHRVCRELGVPYLRLDRPPWTAEPGDRWIEVADLDAALARIAAVGRRPFVNVGRAEIPRLGEVPACRFLLRTVEPPPRVPPNVDVLVGRPPYSVARDRETLRRFGVDSLLVRNAGGPGAHPKIRAARELGLPVVMIRRPPVTVAPVVAGVEEALAYLRSFLGRST